MADNHGTAIAVVDDDPAVLDSLKFLLAVAGYDDVTVYASATAFLDDRAAWPTCLILDQHMPQMTGLELVARLRSEGVNLPILLITGSLSPAILARAAELGIQKVTEKPVSESNLLRFVIAHH
jgi:two-component system, LuxR family, response regulator FixJ